MKDRGVTHWRYPCTIFVTVAQLGPRQCRKPAIGAWSLGLTARQQSPMLRRRSWVEGFRLALEGPGLFRQRL